MCLAVLPSFAKLHKGGVLSAENQKENLQAPLVNDTPNRALNTLGDLSVRRYVFVLCVLRLEMYGVPVMVIHRRRSKREG